ncbi:MAG: hypothetical protein JNM25_06935 [Planctomycetes bacterium]|nr:hypothetical protein [Planctomycetota bacterium]
MLALAADTEAGMAHNVSAIARMLGASRPAVRGWIGWLVDAGLLAIVDGYLRPTADGAVAMTRSDPLPRQLLRRRSKLRPALLRACAATVRETIGTRADQRYVCTDAERGADANLGRRIIAAARRLLVAEGILTAADVQRGRAGLVRLTAVRSAKGKPVSAAGRPMSEQRLQQLAERSARGRRGGNCRTSVGGNCTASPLALRSVEGSPHAPQAPAEQGCEPSLSLEGWPKSQHGEASTVEVPTADARQRRRHAPVAAGDVLGQLMPELPAARDQRAEGATSANARAVAELRRIATDPTAVPRLLRMPAPRAIAQMLAATGVLDKSPRRRDDLAVQVGRVLDPVRLLVLAIDVVLGRPRSVAGALRSRLGRAVAGERELLTRCRASWPVGRFFDEIRCAAAPKGSAPSSPPARPSTSTVPPSGDARRAVGSFDELLRGLGMGDLVARRTTA